MAKDDITKQDATTLDTDKITVGDETTASGEAKENAKGGFKSTARAARLSGAFNQTVGSIKHKFGELMDDEALKKAGKNQEVLGKAHKFVGAVREVKESVNTKLTEKRAEGATILRTHGGKMLDVATDCVRDIKKFLLK